MSAIKLATPSSGSISLSPADTSSNLTITVPAVTGTMAIEGAAFNAYLGTGQSVTAGVVTKLQLNTEVFDTNSCYDTSNYRFTPNVSGYYQINGLVQSATSTNYMSVWIYKNGSNVAVTFANNEFGLGASTSVVVYMNGTTDYVELYAALSANGSIYFNDTRMSGCLVRGA